MGDAAEAERRRIRAAYESYDHDGSSSRWDPSQPGNAALLSERSDQVARLLGEIPAPGRTLELGCGRGDVLATLPLGGGRVGVDLLADRLRDAHINHAGLALILGDGTALPLAGHSVDLAVSFTVFSSVLDDDVRAAIAAELTRVVRPGGRLLWYDLRRANPVNRQVRPVDRRDLRALFPGWTGDVATTTLLPPLARRLGRRADRWYPRLARLGPMRTHLIGVLTRPR